MSISLEYAKSRYKNLKDDAVNWQPQWIELRDYIDTSRGRFYEETPNQGKKIDHTKILKSTAKKSRNVLAAGMLSGLTSPAARWFRLSIGDPLLMQDEGVGRWLEEVEEGMLNIFRTSNIYDAFYNVNLELGQFGTGCGIIDEDPVRGINVRHFTCGEYFIGNDHRGDTIELSRIMNMTPQQIMERPSFNKDNIPTKIKDAYATGMTTRYKVIQLITPNTNRQTGKIDNLNMPWASKYWLHESNDEKKDMFIEESGYNENPIFCPRWEVVSSDTYGRGPGWDALGDVKQLYKQERNKLLALDIITDPPLYVNASTVGPINRLPGGITRFSEASPNNKILPTYQINPNLQSHQAMIDITVQDIKENYFVPLFKMIQGEKREITATEIARRHEQDLMELGAVLNKLERGELNPIIERVFGIMLRNNMLPPPPPVLQGQDINIEYISPLAQAQKMVQATSIEQTVNYIGTLAAVKPEVLDILDADELVYKLADMRGAPKVILRSRPQVAIIRQQRAQQEQAATTMAAAEQGADIAKTASEAKTQDGKSILDRFAQPQATAATP
jgi:hypothetical protein